MAWRRVQVVSEDRWMLCQLIKSLRARGYSAAKTPDRLAFAITFTGRGRGRPRLGAKPAVRWRVEWYEQESRR